MADTIQLEIVTATAPAIKSNIKQIYIPAYLGKAGVLENHKPYISLLKPGEIFYTDTQNKNHYLYIKDGFIEVNDNKIVIISDAVETGDSLDKIEIQTRLGQLKDRINSFLKGEISTEEFKEKVEASLAHQHEAEEMAKKIKGAFKDISQEELAKKIQLYMQGGIIEEEFVKTLEEQKELETKLNILQKMSPDKR